MNVLYSSITIEKRDTNVARLAYLQMCSTNKININWYGVWMYVCDADV